jgi:drug/metabolite transporter (DMT)-like permease
MLLVFSFNFGIGVVSACALPWVWQPIPLDALLRIVLLSAVAFAGHFAFNAAFARADVSVLAPFEYFALVWATLIGYLVWRDIPTLEVWVGAAIITACGLYVVHRESLRRQAR